MYVTKWKEALNWNNVPVFSSIHPLDDNTLEENYYLPDEIKETIETIRASLYEGYGYGNKLIIGPQGCGKTTFLYYLKKILSKEPHFSNQSFHIIHVNRFKAHTNPEEVIICRVLDVLESYFQECGLLGRSHT